MTLTKEQEQRLNDIASKDMQYYPEEDVSDLLEIIDTLRNPWLPIEDCPEDGEQFLVTDGDVVVMAECMGDEMTIHDTTAHMFNEIHPTHWMRLPQPPSGKEG